MCVSQKERGMIVTNSFNMPFPLPPPYPPPPTHLSVVKLWRLESGINLSFHSYR